MCIGKVKYLLVDIKITYSNELNISSCFKTLV